MTTRAISRKRFLVAASASAMLQPMAGRSQAAAAENLKIRIALLFTAFLSGLSPASKASRKKANFQQPASVQAQMRTRTIHSSSSCYLDLLFAHSIPKYLLISALVSVFLIGCREQPSNKDGSTQELSDKSDRLRRTEHQARRPEAIERSESGMSNLGILARSENTRSSGQWDFSSMIEANSNNLSNLLINFQSEVPDIKKADFMIEVSEAAGRAGDTAFFNNLLSFNPGQIKNHGLEAYSRGASGKEAITNVLGLAANDLLKEEKDAIWRGCKVAILALPIEEASTLLSSATVPPDFRQSAAALAGTMLAIQNPTGGLNVIESYPKDIQHSAASSYWMNVAISDPVKGRQALASGIVPEAVQVQVGRSVINHLYQTQTRAAAMEYAIGQSDPKLQGALVNSVFSEWVRNDSMAASEMAVALPPGTARNAAASAIANQLEMLGDKEGAKQWWAIAGRAN